MENLLLGVDVFCLQAERYRNMRFALLTNNAAITSTGRQSRAALLRAGIHIVKLFSPEHGLNAKGDDGAYQYNQVDQLTQLPVISLYGDHLMPTAADMQDIDAVLFDIPDAGCRFYTYLWTMTYAMQACAIHNKQLLVLDRPNPTGAVMAKAEGPMLDEANCASFIGRWNIPVRHTCTLGELAVFFAATKVTNLNLQVIKLASWSRRQASAGWSFSPTSPAIRDVETALLYPGMGLLEGIAVNEGRGTASPFKTLGAPWIDGQQLSNAFDRLQLPGIRATAINYTPAWGMYANEHCAGLQFSVCDAQVFEPVRTGIALLQLIVSLYPLHCTARLYPTVANPSGTAHLDKLSGVYQSFQKLQSGQQLSAQLQPVDWAFIIQPYLLY